jgi:hypothetical protein
VEIIDCPKLSQKYSFNSTGKDFKVPELSEEEKKAIEAEIALEEAREQENEQALTLLKNKDDYSPQELMDELNKLNLNLLDADIREQIEELIKLLKGDESEEQQENNSPADQEQQELTDLKTLAVLITQAQAAVKEENYEEVAKLLEQINHYQHTSSYQLNKRLIDNLAQTLESFKEKSESSDNDNNKTNNNNLLIGGI